MHTMILSCPRSSRRAVGEGQTFCPGLLLNAVAGGTEHLNKVFPTGIPGEDVSHPWALRDPPLLKERFSQSYNRVEYIEVEG